MKAKVGQVIEFGGRYEKIKAKVISVKEVYLVEDEFGIKHTAIENQVKRIFNSQVGWVEPSEA